MSSYPVILFPDNIEHPYVEGEPQPPTAPQQKDILAEAISSGVMGAVKASWLSIPALLIGAAVVGIPGLAIASTVTSIAAVAGAISGASKADDYNSRIFPQERQKYSELLRQHELQLEEFRQTQLPILQQAVREAAIRQTLTFDGTNSIARRGYSEQFFERYLRRYFGDSIRTNLKIVLYQDYPYTPDFTYFDPKTNLHIDIEIDEPYTYDKKQPIHCLGDEREKVRNNHFKSRGWLVVRFAEQQIFEQPYECCALLAELIQKLIRKQYEVQHNNEMGTANIIPVSRWTYSEALKMAEDNYRDSYLNLSRVVK